MIRLKFEERLVVFAAECIFFVEKLPKTQAGYYYADQLLRASGSSALHYGEAQGTSTTKDFIYKVSGSLKELKECIMILKILNHINYGTSESRSQLTREAIELSRIAGRMILNKKTKNTWINSAFVHLLLLPKPLSL